MKICPKCHKQFDDDANFCPNDAAKLMEAAPRPQRETAPGLIGGRFERSTKLGTGPGGDVYRATDTHTGQPAAVKMISDAAANLPQIAGKLDRELKQLERVAHPAIAKVIGSGKDGERAWVAMELVEGARTAAETVAASGPMTALRAAEVVIAVGEALIEAAKVGVVHRDLAPKNVLLASGQIKLINFCLPLPTGGSVPGVVEFLAPDAIDGKPVDQRANIYSLGALTYFLVTGHAPYEGDPAAVAEGHLRGTPQPASQRAAVSAELDVVIAKAMERNSAKRYLTLRQFLDEVARVAGGVAAPAAVVGDAAAGKVAKKPVMMTMIGVGNAPDLLGAAASMAETHRVAPSSLPAMDPAPMMTPAAAPGSPSPWAAPGASPAQPLPAPVVMPSAPVIPASAQVPPAAVRPATAPPATGGAPSGKKRPEEKKSSGKGAFRETMWFKKGDLDVAAAQAAAAERAQGKDVDVDKADSLPMEERYKDDGSITRGDAERYSLRTGRTEMMQVMRPEDAGNAGVSEGELIGEMKGSKTLMFVAIALVLIGAVALIFALR